MNNATEYCKENLHSILTQQTVLRRQINTTKTNHPKKY